jgi:hypothetical protein
MQTVTLSTETRSVEFTNEELDTIYDALEELRFSGEYEDLVASIQDKIASLFQKG